MRCAIVQSNYIPWKGYFDLIRKVDHFILYDCVQYTRRDWRNRNKIKTPQGLQWLTIPVEIKGNYTTPIKEIQVADPHWGSHHWNVIRHNYARAPYFSTEWEELFRTEEKYLSRINRAFIERICVALNIKTPITYSADYEISGDKNERLIQLCQAVGCTEYLSGPSAKSYMDLELFRREGIEVEFMEYAYPAYPQLYPPFEHGVTALDLIFNLGSKAGDYLRDGRVGRSGGVLLQERGSVHS